MHAAAVAPQQDISFDFELPVYSDEFQKSLSCLAAAPFKKSNVDAINCGNRLYRHCHKYRFTRQQYAFIKAAVLFDLDYTKAAIEVGLSVNPIQAEQRARDLMRRDYIAHAVMLCIEYRTLCNKFVFDRDKYLRRLDRMADQNHADFTVLHIDGTASPELPDPVEHREKYDSIKKIKFRKTISGRGEDKQVTHETELELHDPTKATELLFKYCEPQVNARARELGELADGLTNWEPTIFEIVPVPTGEFIPAPEPPTITHIAATG